MRFQSFSQISKHIMGLSFSKRAITLNKLLTGNIDVYDTITVKSKEHEFVNKKFAAQILQNSIEQWKKDEVHGIWFEVNVEDVWWIPILLDNGFIFHHTMPDYVMLTKWLLSRPDTLPKFPFTFIGAGGLVVNSKGDVLLMKEKRGPYLGWKFPGGAADYGELIHETAVREVFEETGVETEFQTLLAFRQTTNFRYDIASNIYFICVLKPKDDSLVLKPCPQETAACKWMPRSEVVSLPETEFRWYNHEILHKYDAWRASNRRGCYHVGVDEAITDAKMSDKSSVTSFEQSEKVEGRPIVHKLGSNDNSPNNSETLASADAVPSDNFVTANAAKKSTWKGFYFFD